MGSKQTPGMSGNRLSKEERRSAAREKARLLREQEERRAKRNRILIIVGIVAVIALVSLVIVKIVTSGNTTDTGSYDGKARSAELANVGDDYGITIGKSGEALPAPNEDLPNVGIFADLMCPHCVELERASADAYAKYIPEGQVSTVHYPVQIMGTDFSKYGTAALFYVATFAPEQYEKFHDELFNRSYQIIIENSAEMPTAAEIADLAAKVGVPEDVVNDLPASIVADDWQKEVEAATEKFRDAGWTGTPTVTIDGKESDAWTNGGVGAVFAEALESAK